MKKILIGVLVCLSLVGCGKDKPTYDDETLVMITDSQMLRDFYTYEDPDNFQKIIDGSIEYVTTCLKEADDLNEYTVSYAEKYLIACYELKSASTEDRVNDILDKLENQEFGYNLLKEDTQTSKAKEVVEEKLPSKREGWDYTVEGLESASSCEQMEGYINYCLRDGRKGEDDIEILNWKIDQVDIVLAENEVEENLLNYFKAYRECCVNLLSAERDVEYQGEIAKLRMAEMFKNN
jgi:hypothetical protein